MRTKFIMFYLFVLCLMVSKQVFAETSVNCLKCTYQQAKTKSLLKARIDRGVSKHYQGEYFTFDPVTLDYRTFRVTIEFDNELRRDIEFVQEINTQQNNIDALNAYNNVLLSFYDVAQGNKPDNEPLALFKVYSSATSSTYTQHDVNQYLYQLIRGTMIFPMHQYSSYNSMLGDYNIEAAISVELGNLFRAEAAWGTLQTGIQQAISDLLLSLPLQYSVQFQNGDVLTFYLDSFATALTFLPLHETASNKNGQKLSSVTKTNTNDFRYNEFYKEMDSESRTLRMVCQTFKTNSGGGWVSQDVCWYVWL